MPRPHKHALPTPEQAVAKYEHGTRARYTLGKCRCFRCKLANADAETARQAARRGPWTVTHTTKKTWIVHHRDSSPANGITFTTVVAARAERERLNKRDRAKPPTALVSTRKARAHLKQLSHHGIGLRTVASKCGIKRSVLQRLIAGDIKRTRRATEAKILAVTTTNAPAGNAKIDGRKTWALLDTLLASGLYTKGWIAMQLGTKTPTLQLGSGKNGRRFVLGRTAQRVKALYDRLWLTDPELRMFVDPDAERSAQQRAQHAANGGRARLRAALASWDYDDLTTRLSRFRQNDDNSEAA